MYKRHLNYIKINFIKRHLDDIINITLWENKDKNNYIVDIKLNYKHNYKMITIDNMNYKLYNNLFNWIFENNWKFPFSIPIKILNNHEIKVMEI